MKPKFLLILPLVIAAFFLFPTTPASAQVCTGTFTCCLRYQTIRTPPGCDPDNTTCAITNNCCTGTTQVCTTTSPGYNCNYYSDENCSIYIPQECLGGVTGTCLPPPTSTPTPTATWYPTSTPTPAPTAAPVACAWCTSSATCAASGGTFSEDNGYCSTPTDGCCAVSGTTNPWTGCIPQCNPGQAGIGEEIGHCDNNGFACASDSNCGGGRCVGMRTCCNGLVQSGYYCQCPDCNIWYAWGACTGSLPATWNSDTNPTTGLQSRTNQCGERQNRACCLSGTVCSAWSGTCDGTVSSLSRTCRTWNGCTLTNTRVETQSCTGTISGTLFDATSLSFCPAPITTGLASVPVTFTNSGTGFTYTATTNASGFYQRSLPAPATYAITYDTSLYPTIINHPAKLYCQGGIQNVALAVGGALTRDIGLNNVVMVDPWFQSSIGNLFGASGITTSIPPTCTDPANLLTCGSFSRGGTSYTPLIRSTASSTAGVAAVSSGTISLGGGGAAPANAVISVSSLNATSAPSTIYDYEYFRRWIARTVGLSLTPWNMASKPASSPTTAYTSSGTLNWSFGLNAGETIVILHDGDVVITADISVPVSAYLSIIASGDIVISSDVSQVEGVFLADTITSMSTNNPDTEVQLQASGTFIGYRGVTLSRDLGALNSSRPSELFTFRPDFVINAPRTMKLAKFVWSEVAP